MVIVVFFFFKQKTAYEMRISDWSSDVCSSDLYGEPTASAKRPNTGVRPGASTAAFDSAWPRPLLSKWPTMQMPFSWARRKPGCSPLWRSSTSATSAPDRREGESQPAVPAKARAMPPTVSAIAPRPATVRRETGTRRRGDCGDGVEGGIMAPVCCSTAVGRPGRRLLPSVDDFAGQGINAAAARHTGNQHRNATRAGTGDTMKPIDDDELRELLPSLRRFALWLARDPADADDLVQACIERALSRWSTRRGDGQIGRASCRERVCQ